MHIGCVHAQAVDAAPTQCHVQGFRQDVLCGSVRRPLDPAAPTGKHIEVHYIVVPAKTREKYPDALFFFAGGPGQSAIGVAPEVQASFARLNNRRDLVFIDQRGAGSSAPLECNNGNPQARLSEILDPRQVAAQCKTALQKLPYASPADLRYFNTTIAMQDTEAVRQALGYERIDAVGISYGTRAVLEYQRQFPQRVRRALLDGVMPPDMVTMLSGSVDAQAAFDTLLHDCADNSACERRYPKLHARWESLLSGLPRTVSATNPANGKTESFTLTRQGLTGMVRAVLYAPTLASALPYAISEAAEQHFTPLVGLSSAIFISGNKAADLAMGMHYSVMCAEDYPRIATSNEKPGADFGNALVDAYRSVCASWFGTGKSVSNEPPPAFYSIPPSQSAVLVLSGGIDPVTPPRHGERVVKALGAKARHVVVSGAGHNILPIGCMRDVVTRFFDAASDAQALAVDTSCVGKIPKPGFYFPQEQTAGGSR
ncbi:MAG: alpha/beta fold hydrolase [Betaproteobacteria bacterium]|nr:alpha/beta fold hydrolase [Betaproteobacteria bacterium]